MNLINKIKKYHKVAYSFGHYPSFKSLLFSKSKVIAYYGFLGDGNFGDELVFEATKTLFKPNLLIPIRPISRMTISAIFFSTFFKYRIAGIIIGGGTLIRGKIKRNGFFKYLNKCDKPIFVHGTGVSSEIEIPENWHKVLRKNFFGGVRGPLSVLNLKNISLNSNVIGDAAFTMFQPVDKNIQLKNNNVLINMGTHLQYADINRSRDEIKRFIEYSFSLGYKVQFLPFHGIDKSIGNELKIQYPNIELLGIPENFNDALKIFKNASFAVGERLHFNVLSILSQCPFFSINYDPKHQDFLLSVDQLNNSSEIKEVTFEIIAQTFHNKDLFNWDKVNKVLLGYKNLQKKEAKRFLANRI